MSSRAVQIARHLALAISFSAIMCVAGGCNVPQSVNPFYRTQDVVFDPSLLGEWERTDTSDKGSLVVKAKTTDSYTIEVKSFDEDRHADVSWTLEAHQFIYRQESYLDCFPIAFQIKGKKDNFQTDANAMFFLAPVHTVLRLQHDRQKISVTWNGESELPNIFKKEDEASKAERLAREKRQHDILTMSTEQLQQDVLGSPPKGTVVTEMGLTFVRKK